MFQQSITIGLLSCDPPLCIYQEITHTKSCLSVCTPAVIFAMLDTLKVFLLVKTPISLNKLVSMSQRNLIWSSFTDSCNSELVYSANTKEVKL